jgi:hypothetical protein
MNYDQQKRAADAARCLDFLKNKLNRAKPKSQPKAAFKSQKRETPKLHATRFHSAAHSDDSAPTNFLQGLRETDRMGDI